MLNKKGLLLIISQGDIPKISSHNYYFVCDDLMKIIYFPQNT